MSKLTIMSGLPASGKSTRAKEIIEDRGGTLRINKDLIREMLHFNKFTGYNEGLTHDASRCLALHFLSKGINVIIDDTNLNPATKQKWVDLGKETKSVIEYIDLDTSVAYCLERNEGRYNMVDDSVIKKMALQYKDYMKGEKVFICDIDGTVADLSHRLKYASGDTKDWDKFFSLIEGDKFIDATWRKVLKDLLNEVGAKLIFVSARPEHLRRQTESWLYNEIGAVCHDLLIMRNDNDKRPDTEVKREIYDKYLSKLNIIKVFDDRPSVIRMWRELGLEVEDCGNGVEF